MLLLYAEALNELNTAPPAKAIECLNRVRNRVKLPNIQNSTYYNGTQITTNKDAFREHLKIERALELAMECVRWIDLKRWNIDDEATLNELKTRDSDFNNFIISKSIRMGFGLPDVELKAVLLDITDAFRKDTADHPTLWKDPRGPREAGIIPVEQLSYIFNKKVPYGIGPLSMMKSEKDKMEYLSHYEQEAIHLLLNILEKSKKPIEILSFGSARILAVAYNRKPELMKKKIHKIYLSAGTASKNHGLRLISAIWITIL